MKHFVFWVIALSVFAGGWFALSVLWMHGHRYESAVPGWRFGHISGGVMPDFSSTNDEIGYFFLGIKAESPGNWYWQAPTNFEYEKIELQTGYERGGHPATDHLSVTLPSLAFRANSSTGTLDAVTLRQFLVDSNAPAGFRPTATDCEWIIKILKLAHEGSFPRPRHHGIDVDEFVDSGLRPPSVFNVSFQHFDLGMGFPWPFWTWLVLWIALVWIARRKWLR